MSVVSHVWKMNQPQERIVNRFLFWGPPLHAFYCCSAHNAFSSALMGTHRYATKMTAMQPWRSLNVTRDPDFEQLHRRLLLLEAAGCLFHW